MFSSWGAAKAPPSTSAARIPAPPPPTRQSRIRELWAGFEQWHAQAKGAADAKRVEAYKTLDKSHKSNKKNKASKAEHEKAKEQKAREIETELVHSARDEWMRRLSENNLRAEDWDDMSVAETRAVEKLLGDRYEDTTPLAAPAPAAAGSPRGGFVLVDPKALSDDEGDEAKKGAAGKLQERPNAHLHHPSDDPAFWNRGALGYAAWGIDSAASSAVSLSSLPTPSSAHSSTPSSARTSPSAGHVPLPPSFSFHAPTPGVASASASAAATASPNPRKHRTLRYIGPVLCEEAHSDEEAEFEEFKVQVRISKICEFHDAAAQQDIRLAVELLKLRKEHRAHGTERSVAREQERALVAQHETNMLNLQRDKEEERHRMVAEEREKRRAEIERRTELQHVLKGRTLESRAHLATPTPETIRKAMEGVEEKRRVVGEGGRPANTRLVELQGSAHEAPRGVEAARASEPAADAHLQEMLRRAEEEGRRMEEAAQRRRAAMQPANTNQQQQGEVDMPGGLPLAPSAPAKAPSALKRVEPVKKADSSPPPPPTKKGEPVLAKKAEPAPAPAPAPAAVQKKEPVTKKGKKAAKKAATTTTTTATPTKAPPPSPSLSSPSLSVSSSTSSALSSSTSTTLTTPAQSRRDSTEDLTRQTNSNQGKPAGKRVAFSPTVEADERAAEKEKAAQASWGWGGALGSLTTALLGEQQPAPPSPQEKGKGKEREVEDAGKSREALVADLRAQAQETLAGFPADTRAHVERMLKEFPAEEGSEVGAPTGYQHVQQPGMWRPSGSSWGEAKAELQNDGWSLEQLAARALQQGFTMDTPTAQAPAQASTSRVPGHVSPPYMPGGISPAHSAGHHSPAHVPGHYSPPQQHIYASPYAAQSQPALNHVPSSFAQGHFAPAQYNNAQPGRYSPPQVPVGSFSPPQPASHEIWLPKPEPTKEAKRADAHHGSKHAEVKVTPKQPEVKPASKPEVKSAFRQPEPPKPKQPEVKSAAKVLPKAPEVKPAPKVEAKPKVSAPQLARAQPAANVASQKVATSSSKTALPKAPVMNSASSSSKPAVAPAPHVKVSAPTATKAPAQADVKHQIWLPSNVPHPRNQPHGLTVPGSPALEHSATLPAIAHPTPLLAGSRPRRMSDPISPSPRMFDRMPAPVVDDAVQPPVQGILKKVKEQIPAKPIANAKAPTNAKKPRAIQVEVIPDNEGEPLNVLPSDARSLLEPVTVAPRPSAPPHAFNHIFDYDEPSASGAQTSSSQGSSSNKAGDSAGMNSKAASSGKNDKAKHVRWTPSVAGTNAGPAEGPSGADVRSVPGKQAPGRPPIRARASMPATGAEKQGAGQKHGDDLQRIAVEAIENLKQTRNKPPSAV